VEPLRDVDAIEIPKRLWHGQCIVIAVESPWRPLIGSFHIFEAAAPCFGLIEKQWDSRCGCAVVNSPVERKRVGRLVGCSFALELYFYLPVEKRSL
jgi:hypothetical protein